jgi:flagellar biogenesis protein FliO
VSWRASVLVLAVGWLGAGAALAQDPSAPSEGASPESVEVPAEPPPADSPSASADAPAGSTAGAGASAPDPIIEELNRKLLSDAPALPDTSAASRRVEEMNLPETPGWLWPTGLLLLALLVGLRWQLNRTEDAPSRLKVVQRVMLGRDGNLAVVEVGEGADRRRLLVGYGGGAPRLVAELDAPNEASAEVAVASNTAARRWQQALQRVLPNGTASTTAGTDPTADRTNGEARLKPRTSLIAEVLAERDPRDDATSTVVVADGPVEPPTSPIGRETDPAVVSDPETGEDGAPKETYTFRGLIG